MKAILPIETAIYEENDQQSRIMAVLFVDLNRFHISVQAKLHETFTVYTVVAFNR